MTTDPASYHIGKHRKCKLNLHNRMAATKVIFVQITFKQNTLRGVVQIFFSCLSFAAKLFNLRSACNQNVEWRY